MSLDVNDMPEDFDLPAGSLELQRDTLAGDVRDAVLAVFKTQRKRWPDMTEEEQRILVAGLETFGRELVRRMVKLLTDWQFPRAVARVVDVKLKKDGIDAKLALSNVKENRDAIGDHVSGMVLLLMVDSEELMGERAPARDHVEPDQADWTKAPPGSPERAAEELRGDPEVEAALERDNRLAAAFREAIVAAGLDVVSMAWSGPGDVLQARVQPWDDADGAWPLQPVLDVIAAAGVAGVTGWEEGGTVIGLQLQPEDGRDSLDRLEAELEEEEASGPDPDAEDDSSDRYASPEEVAADAAAFEASAAELEAQAPRQARRDSTGYHVTEQAEDGTLTMEPDATLDPVAAVPARRRKGGAGK